VVLAIVVDVNGKFGSVPKFGQDPYLWFDFRSADTVDVARIDNLHDGSSSLRRCDGICSDGVAPCIDLSRVCSLLLDVVFKLLISRNGVFPLGEEFLECSMSFFHDIVAALLSDLVVQIGISFWVVLISSDVSAD